jgi:c-di-GMP-binding flagellar brake protein YcgR
MNTETPVSSPQDIPNNTAVTRMPLKALGIRAGMALQTRRLVEGATKKESQFFGAIEGKGVMVGPLGADGVNLELETGEVCVVRGFTGQHEFSFVSKVLQTFEKPFVYALLLYPEQVDVRQVRQSMRIKTSWPTTAMAPATAGTLAVGPIDVTLVDISLSGAMIQSPTALAAIGTTITLSMSVVFDNAPIELRLAAKVCHSNKGTSDSEFYIGMAFSNVSQNDKLVLHFVTQSPQS